MELGADLHPRPRPGREVVDLALRAPVAHHVLEGGDPRERGARRARRRPVVGVGDDPGGDAEVQLGELVAGPLRRRRGRGGDDEQGEESALADQ
jgi:hypothetical protein